MKIGDIEKVGIMMEIFSFLIMMLFIILSRPIPDIVVWIFGMGMIMVFGGALGTMSKRKEL